MLLRSGITDIKKTANCIAANKINVILQPKLHHDGKKKKEKSRRQKYYGR